MGVPTKKLVYDFARKNNLVLTGQGQSLPLVDIIAYLNEFQQIWFNNAVKDAELNQEASNELRRYIEPRVELTLQNVDSNTVYAVYPTGLHTRLNQLAIITKPDCCGDLEKKVIIKVLQSDDINPARMNTFKKSTFFFERLVSTVGENGLLIYHDGSCTINKVIIDYYRKPNELHAPSLEICDGPHYYDYKGDIITEDTEFEGDTFSDNFISDGASLIHSADKRDPAGFDLKLKRFLQARNIYSVRE